MIRSLTYEGGAFAGRRNRGNTRPRGPRARTSTPSAVAALVQKRRDEPKGLSTEQDHHLQGPLLAMLANHAIGRSLHPTAVGWRLTPGCRQDGLQAEGSHLLVICLQGNAWLEARAQSHKLRAGEAIVVPSGTSYSYGNGGESNSARLFWVRFRGEDSGYYVRALSEGISVVPTDPQTREQVMSGLRQLSSLMSDTASELRLLHACHLLRLLLGQLFCVNSCYDRPENPPRHPSIDSALAYMQAHVGQALSLAEIARHAGLSVSYFCGLFGQQMGISPMDYLIQLKLRRACRLLVTTALTIQEVAHQVGYDDAYYFSRLFRKLHGVPPVAYRKENALAA